MFDVAIVGSGPAGAACAAFCARAGVQTLLLEREKFPREKVCGDCLNPACWPVLARLAVDGAVRQLPHGRLDSVEFIGTSGRSLRIALPCGDNAEIAVKRNFFDALLMSRAQKLGAEVREGTTVTSVSLSDTVWTIETRGEIFQARVLVAADGRNSTVARLCDSLPRVIKERVALQTHLPLPRGFGNRIVLQFLRAGYSGQAPVGEDQLNLCLVAKPGDIAEVKRWAEEKFAIPQDHSWRTITPLTRAPILSTHPRLFLVGDAARVVEPFTGEGIYYALRSGELAAESIISIVNGGDEEHGRRKFNAAHGAMYRGRLWLNRVARMAVLNPRMTSLALEAARCQPSILRFMTAKIVR
jgi:menaquinone-9 beta-reductase